MMPRLTVPFLLLTITLAGCTLDWEEKRYSGTLRAVDICVEKTNRTCRRLHNQKSMCKKHAEEVLVLEPFDLSGPFGGLYSYELRRTSIPIPT